MASGFGAASLPLLSAIALLVGAILLILGFAAPYWAFDGTHYRGLWRYGRCANEGHRDCYHYDEPSIGYIEGNNAIYSYITNKHSSLVIKISFSRFLSNPTV